MRNDKIENVLVFTRTKHGADNVVKALKKNNVTAEAIHGDKSQNASADESEPQTFWGGHTKLHSGM